MLSKSQISLVVSLHQKKFRKQEGLFVAEGEKIVEELLASSWTVKKIFATESFLQKTDLKKKKKSSIKWVEVSENELKKISSLATPNKVLALVEMPVDRLEEEKIKNSLSLVLDDISDPGNLGTILRIADWFGIGQIICSQDTADCYNAKVVQASMGSLFRIRIHYKDLKNFLEQNTLTTKLHVYGMMLSGENIYSADLSSPGFIVVGSESKGIREELKNYFSHALFIPSFSSAENKPVPDSLNAAVAAAIVCAEFRRREW